MSVNANSDGMVAVWEGGRGQCGCSNGGSVGKEMVAVIECG